MAYEKADFYAAYGVYAVDPVTRHRYANFRSPETNGEAVTLRLHYHPAVIKPAKQRMAERLVTYFQEQGTPLTASDRIVIIGGAFGWTGEALEDLVLGLEAISIDLSQYVQDTKNSSPDDELIESIEAEGHTINDGGIGQMLYEKFKDSKPRSRDGSKVLKENLNSQESLNVIRKTLRQSNPTRIITEEVWQILPREEKNKYTAVSKSWGAPLTHIIDGVIV